MSRYKPALRIATFKLHYLLGGGAVPFFLMVMGDWVVLPNHFHWIFISQGGDCMRIGGGRGDRVISKLPLTIDFNSPDQTL